MTILHCPQVVNENGEHEQLSIQSQYIIYLSDGLPGTMECFTGYHIPLALCAIIVLVICTLLIPFLHGLSGHWKTNGNCHTCTYSS